MSKIFNSLILLGIFIFALGMFMLNFYQANSPLVDYFGLSNGLIIVGAITFFVGIIGKIIKWK